MKKASRETALSIEVCVLLAAAREQPAERVWALCRVTGIGVGALQRGLDPNDLAELRMAAVALRDVFGWELLTLVALRRLPAMATTRWWSDVSLDANTRRADAARRRALVNALHERTLEECLALLSYVELRAALVAETDAPHDSIADASEYLRSIGGVLRSLPGSRARRRITRAR